MKNKYFKDYLHIIFKMEVYGFIGNMGCGKNYIAEKVFLPKLKPKPTLVMAFADHFKVTAICFENLDYNKVFGEKDEHTRKKLQLLGTELGRDKYGNDIWLKVLYNWMKVYNERGIERFIITDVRFENETYMIKTLGGEIWRIQRPEVGPVNNHISETELKDYAADRTLLNAGTLNDLETLVKLRLDSYLAYQNNQ